MGMDIHAHIEVKRDGRWLHYAAPAISRNYNLFALISGARQGSEPVTPVASHLGKLPDDTSEVTEFCYEQDKSGMRVHHEGWLTADDLTKLRDMLQDVPNPDPRYAHRGTDLESDVFGTYINGNCIASHQGWDDVRVVFWFDN